MLFRVRLVHIRSDQSAAIRTEGFRLMAWGEWGLRFNSGDRALCPAGERAAVI